MIFALLVDGVAGLFNFLIQFFPLANSSVVAYVTDQIVEFRALMVQANWIFPVADFFSVVSMVFLVESVYWLFKGIKYILSILTLNLVR